MTALFHFIFGLMKLLTVIIALLFVSSCGDSVKLKMYKETLSSTLSECRTMNRSLKKPKNGKSAATAIISARKKLKALSKGLLELSTTYPEQPSEVRQDSENVIECFKDFSNLETALKTKFENDRYFKRALAEELSKEKSNYVRPKI